MASDTPLAQPTGDPQSCGSQLPRGKRLVGLDPCRTLSESDFCEIGREVAASWKRLTKAVVFRGAAAMYLTMDRWWA